MPLHIVTVPCLSDNYAYLIHNSDTGETAVVDVPDAAPIQAELENRGWQLTDILITHHHWDHTDGVDPLRTATGARVIGCAEDVHRLPKLDAAVSDGDVTTICGRPVRIFDVSGHTIHHIAFYFSDDASVFTADSLMALGCGRVFEGTMPQMWESLSKLAALPTDTMVYSGHEYTASNAKFALTIEPDNNDLKSRVDDISAKRAQGIPTVPSELALELATNPFLRANNPHVKAALGMEGATDAETFAEIRHRKDQF